jgi:copper(I)-binding protein
MKFRSLSVLCLSALLVLGLASPQVQAQLSSVKEPWVRATVPRQKSTAAYMEITAPRAGRLLEASSPVAGVVEIHEMRMENNVMRMRAVPSIDLPAGRPVELKPGGYHIMLMDLRRHLREGDEVPMQLLIEYRNGVRETISIEAAIRGTPGADTHGSSAHGSAGHGSTGHSSPAQGASPAAASGAGTRAGHGKP